MGAPRRVPVPGVQAPTGAAVACRTAHAAAVVADAATVAVRHRPLNAPAPATRLLEVPIAGAYPDTGVGVADIERRRVTGSSTAPPQSAGVLLDASLVNLTSVG